jgi:hypothetical protein
MTGKYTFQLSDGLGVTTCAYHESGLGLWSFGLSAFAVANGMLEFVETETIKPVMVENTIKLYAKISNDPSNLLQMRDEPSIVDDPLGPVLPPALVGQKDEYDAGGLYYGITAPVDVRNQYVSTTLGNDVTGDGSHDAPFYSIAHAMNRIPEGTTATIWLRFGETFYTYSPDSAPISGGPRDTSIVTGHTFIDSIVHYSTLISVGNRLVTIQPYDDPCIKAINDYSASSGTLNNPYLAAEIQFPRIVISLFQASDGPTTYVPSSIAIESNGVLSFLAVNVEMPKTGNATSGFSGSGFGHAGIILFGGGQITLAEIPMFGKPMGQAGFAANLAFSNVNIKDHSPPSVAMKIASLGSRLTIVTNPYSAGGNTLIPASGLPYTHNPDTPEDFLRNRAKWIGLTVFGPDQSGVGSGDARYRCYRNLVTTTSIDLA